MIIGKPDDETIYNALTLFYKLWAQDNNIEIEIVRKDKNETKKGE